MCEENVKMEETVVEAAEVVEEKEDRKSVV